MIVDDKETPDTRNVRVCINFSEPYTLTHFLVAAMYIHGRLILAGMFILVCSSFLLQDTTKIIIKYKNYVCGGPRSLIWIIYSYGCVVLTQIVAFVLAFRTRKVTIKALNDSKYLTIIIYLSTVIIVAMVISAVFLDEFLNTDAGIFGGLIMLFTTVVLALTFIPKVNLLLYLSMYDVRTCIQVQSIYVLVFQNLVQWFQQGSNQPRILLSAQQQIF